MRQRQRVLAPGGGLGWGVAVALLASVAATGLLAVGQLPAAGAAAAAACTAVGVVGWLARRGTATRRATRVSCLSERQIRHEVSVGLAALDSWLQESSP